MQLGAGRAAPSCSYVLCVSVYIYTAKHKHAVIVPGNFLCVLSGDVSSEPSACRTQHLPVTASTETAPVPNKGAWTWLYRWAVCTQGYSGPTCLFPLVMPPQAAQERGRQPRGFAESAVRDRICHSRSRLWLNAAVRPQDWWWLWTFSILVTNRAVGWRCKVPAFFPLCILSSTKQRM